MGLSLSLDFGAVVWRIEEEAMPLSVFTFVFVIFLGAVAFQPIYLYVVSRHFVSFVAVYKTTI